MITDTGVAVPEDMAAALNADPAAMQAFSAMRPGDQRSFVDWLAKPASLTRQERLAELADHIHRFGSAARA